MPSQQNHTAFGRGRQGDKPLAAVVFSSEDPLEFGQFDWLAGTENSTFKVMWTGPGAQP